MLHQGGRRDVGITPELTEPSDLSGMTDGLTSNRQRPQLTPEAAAKVQRILDKAARRLLNERIAEEAKGTGTPSAPESDR